VGDPEACRRVARAGATTPQLAYSGHLRLMLSEPVQQQENP
jgi:hypothetical protein